MVDYIATFFGAKDANGKLCTHDLDKICKERGAYLVVGMVRIDPTEPLVAARKVCDIRSMYLVDNNIFVEHMDLNHGTEIRTRVVFPSSEKDKPETKSLLDAINRVYDKFLDYEVKKSTLKTRQFAEAFKQRPN